MNKPVNFEKISHTSYKILGINWDIQINPLSNSMSKGDYSRVWLTPDAEGEKKITRAFYFDIFWNNNRCEVVVPLIGEGEHGPHIKHYPLKNEDFKTSEIFKSWISDLVADVFNNFNLQNKGGVMGGFTALSFLVKSDTSDTEYAVEYMNSNWSCTCKGFTYSKQLPQTCKHISKIKE